MAATSEKSDFKDIVNGMREGMTTLEAMFGSNKIVAQQIIQFIDSINQHRQLQYSDNPHESQQLTNEHQSIVQIGMLFHTMEEVIMKTKTQLEMRCNLVEKIFIDMESDLKRNETQMIARLKHDLKRSKTKISDLMGVNGSLVGEMKSLTGMVEKLETGKMRAKSAMDSLQNLYKVLEKDAQESRERFKTSMNAALNESRKHTEERDEALSEFSDLEVKYKELLSENHDLKTRISVALKYKDAQEKAQFDLKGEMRILESALEEMKITSKDKDKDFERLQESNINKIRRLESEKEIMLSKRSDSENIFRSIVSAQKVTDKFFPAEVSSVILETILHLKPDTKTAFELESIFGTISSEQSLDKKSVLGRIIDLAEHKKAITPLKMDQREIFDKISRYFTIIADRNYMIEDRKTGSEYIELAGAMFRSTDPMSEVNKKYARILSGKAPEDDKDAGADEKTADDEVEKDEMTCEELTQYLKAKYGH